MTAAESGVRFRELHVRDPGLEELRAEGQHELGAIEVVARNLRTPERQIGSRANRVIFERLIGQPPRAAESRKPGGRELFEWTGLETAEPRNAVRSATPRIAQFRREQLLGVAPRDRLQDPVRVSDEWLPEPEWVVDRLYGRLTPRAQPATPDGMLRIALRLRDSAIDGLRNQPAPRRTRAARCRVVRWCAGDDRIGRHEIRDQSLRRLSRARIERRRRSRKAQRFQELPAFDHARLPISNGM